MINQRIKLIRKKVPLSQDEFGAKIGITKSSVSLLESGRNNPSDQTIKLICQQFNINEDWLRDGAGSEENMYIPDDMVFLNNMGRMAGEQNEFKKFCLNMMMGLPDEYWNYIYEEFKKFENKKGD